MDAVEKLKFNFDGVIKEASESESIEQRKQWMIDFSERLDAWFKEMVNENK